MMESGYEEAIVVAEAAAEEEEMEVEDTTAAPKGMDTSVLSQGTSRTGVFKTPSPQSAGARAEGRTERMEGEEVDHTNGNEEEEQKQEQEEKKKEKEGDMDVEGAQECKSCGTEPPVTPCGAQANCVAVPLAAAFARSGAGDGDGRADVVRGPPSEAHKKFGLRMAIAGYFGGTRSEGALAFQQGKPLHTFRVFERDGERLGCSIVGGKADWRQVLRVGHITLLRRGKGAAVATLLAATDICALMAEAVRLGHEEIVQFLIDDKMLAKKVAEHAAHHLPHRRAEWKQIVAAAIQRDDGRTLLWLEESARAVFEAKSRSPYLSGAHTYVATNFWTDLVALGARLGSLQATDRYCRQLKAHLVADAEDKDETAEEWRDHTEVSRERPRPQHLGELKAWKSMLDNAVEGESMDVVEYLHSGHNARASPAAIDIAAAAGNLSLVEWVHRNCPDAGATTDAMDAAARFGALSVVEFLHFHRSEGCTTDALGFAATHGHLSVVEFLTTHRDEGHVFRVVSACQARGHGAVARYLRAHRAECRAKPSAIPLRGAVARYAVLELPAL